MQEMPKERSNAVARAGGASNASRHRAHVQQRDSVFLPVTNARHADYGRRDPLVPGRLPGCRPLSAPVHSGPISAGMPMPQTEIQSMKTRHELRQALGPSFSHKAESQLITNLRGLASGGTTTEEASVNGMLTLGKLSEAFAVWGVSDQDLLCRFWASLSEAAGDPGSSELNVRFVTEEIRTVITLSARSAIDEAGALRQWKSRQETLRHMDGRPVRRTISAWSFLQVDGQTAPQSARGGAKDARDEGQARAGPMAEVADEEESPVVLTSGELAMMQQMEEQALAGTKRMAMVSSAAIKSRDLRIDVLEQDLDQVCVLQICVRSVHCLGPLTHTLTHTVSKTDDDSAAPAVLFWCGGALVLWNECVYI